MEINNVELYLRVISVAGFVFVFAFFFFSFYRLTKIFSGVVASCSLLPGARRRKARSKNLVRPEDTSGCNPGTSGVIFFPLQASSASGRPKGVRPSGNQLIW